VYKIDKNIPIPEIENKIKGFRKRIYPFKEMEIGDSFFVPGKTNLSSVGSSFYKYIQKTGRKYITRRLVEKKY